MKQRRFIAPSAVLWLLLGAAYFMIPLVATLLFSLKSNTTGKCCTAANYGWVLHNGLRYDDYTLARGANATVPFYRVFVTDKLVAASNGPASRELAQAVQHDLLPKQPYRAYRITLHDFFSKASSRMEVARSAGGPSLDHADNAAGRARQAGSHP